MKRFLSLLFCTLIFCPPAFAAAKPKAAGIIVKKTAKQETKPEAAVLPEITPMPFNIPQVQRVMTKSGIEAWLIEEKSAPSIAMSVVFKGGRASDPKRLTGISSLATDLMTEGAGRLKSEQFQEILAEKAIGISFGSSTDTLSAGLETLRDNKEEAFELFRLALTEPRFDRKDIRRRKDRMYASIEARKGSPNALAGERWAKLVYKDHPYADLLPTAKTVGAITRANLRSFVKHRFARDNMVIGVAGNISAEELEPLLEKTFSGLPEKAKYRKVPPYTPELSARVDVLTMDIPQSAVLFGHQGFARNDPDFYAAMLVNYSFGGGSFASRLFSEVREKNGLAYSVGTGLSPSQASPMFIGSVGSDNAKLSGAIDIIRREWQKMAESGPTAEELKDAKTYLTGSFPLSFTSSGGLASFLVSMQYNELGIDYLKNRNDILNAVTLEQAQAAANRLLQPDSLFFVVVGKPANL